MSCGSSLLSLLVGHHQQTQNANQGILEVRIVVHDDGDHPHLWQVPASIGGTKHGMVDGSQIPQMPLTKDAMQAGPGR